MNFEDLEKLVIKWAEDRGLIQATTSEAQCLKLKEEYDELVESFSSGTISDTRDAIGDMLVVLTIIAKLNGLDLFQCYTTAYLEIKYRKGRMANGLFVKEQ